MKVNLRTKLLIQFLLVGTIPLIITSGLAYFTASQSLKIAVFDKLRSVQQIKKNAVERYFHEISDQIQTFSENQMIVDAAREFKKSFHGFKSDISDAKFKSMKRKLFTYYSGPFANEYRKENGDIDPLIKDKFEQLDKDGVLFQYYYIQNNFHPQGSKHRLNAADDGGSAYSKIHKKVHPIIRNYLEKFGYYDIFIVDAETGHIVYSVFKELDFATSLKTGPFKDTNFADVYRIAAGSSQKEFVKLADYKRYWPSYEAPASFVASPIFDGDKKIAVAIFQMPINRLNSIMEERNGMGETGETILVGPDKLVRSNSHLDMVNRNVVSSFRTPAKAKIDLAEVDKGIAGETGEGIHQNYLDQEVLSTFAPVKVIGLTWVLLAQLNTEEALAPVRKLSYLMGAMVGGAIILTLIVGLIIGRSIANPILRIAGELAENSKQVAGASEGLASASGSLSELAAEQASSIEETASSIEEISAMIKNNVEKSEKSSMLSEQVKVVADKGNQSMNMLVTSMAEIIDSNQKIQELVKVIGEIGEKTGVIDEIVFQTKLLSFNASVEAERAGEHGRGFAVVAQEVGNLAQMSGKAASEIATMVKGSIKNAEKITSENKSKVEQGNNLVQETAKYLAEIGGDAEFLLKQAQQITNSSKEQSEGIAQINEAMSQLDQATQQNSATAEETASSSEQLASQAEYLKENVVNLLFLVEGKGNGDKLVANKTVDQKPDHDKKKAPIVDLRTKRKQNTESATLIKKASGDDMTASHSNENWEKL